MIFGPFRVKSATGVRPITSVEDASQFIRSVEYRTRPHWRIAERMLEFAWMSDADSAAAEYAFRHALEKDDLESSSY